MKKQFFYIENIISLEDGDFGKQQKLTSLSF